MRAGRPAVATAAWGGTALFLIGWATASLTNASETLFLKRIGVADLPFVFLANSLLLALSTFLVGRWIARSDHGRALTTVLVVLAAALVPLWLGLAANLPGTIGALVVAAKQIQAVALLAFWIALGGWLDSREAKRTIAPLLAGGTLGGIAGSFSSSTIGEAFGIAGLVPVAAVALLLAAGATLALRRASAVRVEWPRWSRREKHRTTPRLLAVWRRSGLFQLSAAAAFLGGLLAPVLYFQFSVAADAATTGLHAEQRLLELYGRFRGWLGVAVLALQLGGTAWLFQRIGVPRAALLAPGIYFLGFAGLAIDGTLFAAIGAMAGTTLQDRALQEPAERTLATLFPERLRPTVAALLDGAVKRAGGVVGNALVLVAIAVSLESALPVVAMALALAWLAVGAVLARIYPTLLVEAVAARRLGERGERGEVPDADLVDARTVRLLGASLADPDPRRVRAACELLREAPSGAAVAVVVRGLLACPPDGVPVLRETLSRLLESPAAILQPADSATASDALRSVLARSDVAPVDTALLVLLHGSLERSPSEEVRTILARFAERDPAIALALRLALDDSTTSAFDDDLLEQAIHSPDGAHRRVAGAALRARLLAAPSSEERFDRDLGRLAELLAFPAERAATAEAFAEIAAAHGAAVAPIVRPVLAHEEDSEPAVRASLLRFVGHARLQRRARWAVSRLTSSDESEVAAAQDALRLLGADSIDVILEAFHCDCRHTRGALLPVLRDMPLDGDTLRDLLDRELDGIRRALALERAIVGAPASGLVHQRLDERVDEGTRAALSLLAALLRDDRIAEIGPLLERVRARRERALLLEALEALVPDPQASALLDLLDRRSGADGADGAHLGFEALTPEQALRSALADDDSLTRAFVASSLDEEDLHRLGGVPAFLPDEPAFALTPLRPLARARDSSEDPGSDEDGTVPSSGVEIILQLRSLELFERLTTRQLTELAGIVREVSFPSGTTIVREGDFDDCMYLIVDGRVEITRAGRRLGGFGPRDFFGEMAVLDGETRSATAVATSRVRLLRIDRADLLEVMDDHPGIAIAVCQTLSRRVRELNGALDGLRKDER
ncbi:MAG: cyclic nucleotide-binding domain-containing protein [Deltaproteobacteria bacterium]|nr:cyclic nucleotide-binding domain-containing protein [Deltaproteobacteria bacterium]